MNFRGQTFSFRQQVISLVLLSTLLPLLIMGYLWYDQQHTSLKNEFQAILTMLVQQSSHQVEQWRQERNRQAQNLATTTLLHEELQRLLATDPKSDEYFLIQYRLHRQLGLMMKAHLWILEVELNHPVTGQVLMSNNPSKIGKKFPGTPQHLDQLQNGHTLASPVAFSKTPIRNTQGVLENHYPIRQIFSPIQLGEDVTGILTLHTNALEIGDQIFSLKASSFSDRVGSNTLDVYLVDGQGFFLSPSSFRDRLEKSRKIVRRTELELQVTVPGQHTMTRAFHAC